MNKMCEKKNKTDIFTWKEWLLFLPLFIIYIVLGFHVLFIANPLLAYCYVIYIVLFFHIGVFYFFCTKCPHYGQRCSYIYGGLLVKRLFKKREGNCSFFEKIYPVIAMVILLVFPILFVLDKLQYLIAFLGMFILMFGIIKPYIVCAKCKYSNCLAKSISNKVKSEKREDD